MAKKRRKNLVKLKHRAAMTRKESFMAIRTFCVKIPIFKSRFSKKHLEIPTKKRIFAATNPTTPLNDAYHGGLRFLYGYMNYDKQPINIDEQLALLQNRGLIDRGCCNSQITASQYQLFPYS